MVTTEDCVLSKLEWARQSGDSPKQLTATLRPSWRSTRHSTGRTSKRWAEVLGVSDLWRQIGEGG